MLPYLGQYVLSNTREDVCEFVKVLSVRKVPGVGKVTERMLQALGISTGDLVRQLDTLSRIFTPF